MKDWATTDNTEAFYAAGQRGQLGSNGAAGFFLPVLEQQDYESEEWLDYDSNADGVLDSVLVIHSGFDGLVPGGRSCGNGSLNRIASQASAASEAWFDPFWNLQLSNYAIASPYERLCNFENYAHIGLMVSFSVRGF